jgi:hypothetical protein
MKRGAESDPCRRTGPVRGQTRKQRLARSRSRRRSVSSADGPRTWTSAASPAASRPNRIAGLAGERIVAEAIVRLERAGRSPLGNAIANWPRGLVIAGVAKRYHGPALSGALLRQWNRGRPGKRENQSDRGWPRSQSLRYPREAQTLGAVTLTAAVETFR